MASNEILRIVPSMFIQSFEEVFRRKEVLNPQHPEFWKIIKEMKISSLVCAIEHCSQVNANIPV